MTTTTAENIGTLSDALARRPFSGGTDVSTWRIVARSPELAASFASDLESSDELVALALPGWDDEGFLQALVPSSRITGSLIVVDDHGGEAALPPLEALRAILSSTRRVGVISPHPELDPEGLGAGEPRPFRLDGEVWTLRWVPPAQLRPRGAMGRAGAGARHADLALDPTRDHLRDVRQPASMDAWVDEHTSGERLRSLRRSIIDADRNGAGSAARAVVRAAANGSVPIVTGADQRWRGMVAPELLLILQAALATDLDDGPSCEHLSVRLHRATAGHLPGHDPMRGLGNLERISVSVVIATKRAGFLRHVERQIAKQVHGNVEVIVVGHGPEMAAPLASFGDTFGGRPLTGLTAPTEVRLGELLRRGADVATGDIVCKMDDDDWYGPHHLTDLVHGLVGSGGDLVGKAAEFFYLADIDRTVRRAVRGPEVSPWLLSGATLSIWRHRLREIGGWLNAARAVDQGLIESVLIAGGCIHRIHSLELLVNRHGLDATWKAASSEFLSPTSHQWAGFAGGVCGVTR